MQGPRGLLTRGHPASVRGDQQRNEEIIPGATDTTPALPFRRAVANDTPDQESGDPLDRPGSCTVLPDVSQKGNPAYVPGHV